MSTIGQRIRNRRKELSLTLEDVGRAVGVPRSTIQRWETGTIRNMGQTSLLLLAQALQTTTDYLVGATDTVDREARLHQSMAHDLDMLAAFDFLSAESGFATVDSESGSCLVRGDLAIPRTPELVMDLMRQTTDYFAFLLSRYT